MAIATHPYVRGSNPPSGGRRGVPARVKATLVADLLDELTALRTEFREDVAALQGQALLFAAIAAHLSPAAHQSAVGMQRRLARMAARLEAAP